MTTLLHYIVFFNTQVCLYHYF